jgi:hypothetical protein
MRVRRCVIWNDGVLALGADEDHILGVDDIGRAEQERINNGVFVWADQGLVFIGAG